MQQPKTIVDLIVALRRLADLPPVERARACPGLIDAAKGVLADERARAMRDAVADGWSKAGLARELSITRNGLYEALARLDADPN